MHPLVARIEAARVADHGNESGFFLSRHQRFGIGEVVGHRDFHQNVFAGAQDLLSLAGVQRSRRGEDGPLDSGLRQPFLQIERPPGNVVLLGGLLRGFGHAPDEGGDFHACDVGQCVQMLAGEGTLADHAEFHPFSPVLRFQEW